MGERGPKPIPSAIKRLSGTYRADRAGGNEPSPIGRPTCPKWLSPEEAREFRRLSKQLTQMGVVGASDQNALARYCRLWCRWRDAEQNISKSGTVIILKDKDGRVTNAMPSPYVSIANKLAAELSRLEQSLGLNPSARSRINVTQAGTEPDALSQFLSQTPPIRIAQ